MTISQLVIAHQQILTCGLYFVREGNMPFFLFPDDSMHTKHPTHFDFASQVSLSFKKWTDFWNFQEVWPLIYGYLLTRVSHMSVWDQFLWGSPSFSLSRQASYSSCKLWVPTLYSRKRKRTDLLLHVCFFVFGGKILSRGSAAFSHSSHEWQAWTWSPVYPNQSLANTR